MKKLFLILLIAIMCAIGFVCLIAVLPPAAPTGSSITFTVKSLSNSNAYPRTEAVIIPHDHRPPDVSRTFVLAAIHDTNGWSRVCDITVSNSSDAALLVYGGSSTLWFTVKFLTNGVWQEYSTRTVDGGPGLIPPRSVKANNLFEIPNGAARLKIGLSFTSCTWRSLAAWRYRLPNGIRDFLFSQDYKHRSRTEWSCEYIVLSNSLVQIEPKI